MASGSFYQEMIRQVLVSESCAGMDPRHIEAYMRVGHPTLDGLSYPEFRFEVAVAIECIAAGGVQGAEALAKSFGL